MKTSVCIDAVYRATPPAEAVAAVHSLGFHAIEFWSWWDKDIVELKAACDSHGIAIAAFCTRFVSLVDRSSHEEYQHGLVETLEVAETLNTPVIISQVGNELVGVPRRDQRNALVAGLKRVAPLLERAQRTLVIEPLNVEVDHAGYYLARSKEAFEIVREVDCPWIKVLFDIYHQQITEGDILRTITSGIESIGHFHAAGNPGRGELDGGELCYERIVHAISRTGFEGYFGLEYFPARPAAEGLEKLRTTMAADLSI